MTNGEGDLMKVLVMAEAFPPSTKTGGPSRSLAYIVANEQYDAVISVLTRDRDLGEQAPYPEPLVHSVRERFSSATLQFLKPGPLAFSRAFWRESRNVDLIYLNSLFAPWSSLLPMGLLRLRRHPPLLLIAPRGELNPGALSLKARKKRMALAFLAVILRGRPVVWHATSENDAKLLAHHPLSAPFPILRRYMVSEPRALEFEPPNVTTIAFVGRMARIKNFKTLLRAILDFAYPLEVVSVGNIEDDDYWSECKALINQLPSTITLHVMGEQPHEVVLSTLSRAHALILPTAGESYGHAIAEALSIGCPVALPDTTPWTPLIRGGAGWLIDAQDPKPIQDVLIDLVTRSPENHMYIRQRVHALYKGWHDKASPSSPLFCSAAQLWATRDEH